MMLRYSILLTVQVLHDYFANLKCEDLDIVPSTDTARALRGHDMLVKTIGNKLILLLKTDGSGKPVALPDPSLKLSFYVGINNVRFPNYTNIDHRPSGSEKLYFTNLNQTIVNTTLYLNTVITGYNNANSYPVGTLAGDTMGNIYEAIRSSDSGNIHALSDTDYWLLKGTAQYVSNNDQIPLVGDSFLYNTAPVNDFTVHIYTISTSTNIYDALLVTDTQHFDTPQVSYVVDLAHLKSGKYRIEVNGNSSLVYHDNAAVLRNDFGLIELFNHLPAANSFSWFDAAGMPKQNIFTLRFANRSALWKYIARTTDVTAIKDNTSLYTFNNIPSSTTFISSVPIPFRERPIDSFFLESASLGQVSPIPNPPADRLTKVTRGGDNYYCAEKHLNY
jgi:hypothetical protein